MKYLVPAVIIGFVGGMLDTLTGLHKIWCFLIGVAIFCLFLLVKSAFTTNKILKQTKGARKVWLDKNNNVIKADYE